MIIERKGQMKHCTNCGKEYGDDNAFCPYCDERYGEATASNDVISGSFPEYFSAFIVPPDAKTGSFVCLKSCSRAFMWSVCSWVMNTASMPSKSVSISESAFFSALKEQPASTSIP